MILLINQGVILLQTLRLDDPFPAQCLRQLARHAKAGRWPIARRRRWCSAVAFSLKGFRRLFLEGFLCDLSLERLIIQGLLKHVLLQEG